MDAFLISFGIIFVAELGDKSQLMALTFAARYKALTILLAITVATALVHLVSVLVGAVVGVALPTDAISILGGLAFLGFAAWTLRGDELGDDDEAEPRARRRRCSSRWPARSSWRSWATRPCSPPSPSRPITAWSAPGSARRSAWWRPTRSRCCSASSSGPDCPSGPSGSVPP